MAQLLTDTPDGRQLKRGGGGERVTKIRGLNVQEAFERAGRRKVVTGSIANRSVIILVLPWSHLKLYCNTGTRSAGERKGALAPSATSTATRGPQSHG